MTLDPGDGGAPRGLFSQLDLGGGLDLGVVSGLPERNGDSTADTEYILTVLGDIDVVSPVDIGIGQTNAEVGGTVLGGEIDERP